MVEIQLQFFLLPGQQLYSYFTPNSAMKQARLSCSILW